MNIHKNIELIRVSGFPKPNVIDSLNLCMQTVNTTAPTVRASSQNYYAEATIGEPETKIYFKVLNTKYRTSSYPQTLQILKTHLPGVLETKCFNHEGNGFAKEVLNTEISHLFEHILLQYLYEIKKSYCADPITFSGWTTWDWGKEPAGTFMIQINSDCEYAEYFNEAFQKSISLTNLILQSSN